MERLWISNFASQSSDEELIALVEKYGPGLECIKIQRVEGTGNRPGALLWFTHRNADQASGATLPNSVVPLESLKTLSRRLDGLYWKGHTLSSSVVVFEPKP